MDESPQYKEVAADEVFAQQIRDAAEEADEMPRDRATRFYDRIRNTIRSYVEKKGALLGKTADFLLLVPDVFILLWRLTMDARVGGKDKVLLGSAVAYYVMPFDFIPEAIVGPVGYLDDLVLGVFVLNKVIGSVDPSVIREHWSGSENVLDMIQRVLNAASGLIGDDTTNKIRKMMATK